MLNACTALGLVSIQWFSSQAVLSMLMWGCVPSTAVITPRQPYPEKHIKKLVKPRVGNSTIDEWFIKMSPAISLATSLENDDAVPRRLSRSYVACTRCHDHKVKCTGETPKCRNCHRAKEPQDCVYPVRDRKLSVPQRYMLLVSVPN